MAAGKEKVTTREKVQNVFAVLLAVGLALVVAGAMLNDLKPNVVRIPAPTVRADGYYQAAVGDYYIPAMFPGDPFILMTEGGDTLNVLPGDRLEYKDVTGSIYSCMEKLCEYFHPMAYPVLFPTGIQYAATTTWSKPHPVPWVKGRITTATAKYVADPVFMPRTMGVQAVLPLMWTFPDVELPYGMPMVSIKAGPFWSKGGAGLSNGQGWLEVQKAGPVVCYLNYNYVGILKPLRPANATVEWRKVRIPTGIDFYNQGWIKVRICVWRPQTAPGST